jgi:hypothetical protein
LYIMQKKTIFSCHVDGNLEPQVSIQLKLVAFHVMPWMIAVMQKKLFSPIMKGGNPPPKAQFIY